MNEELKFIADNFGPVTQLAKQVEEGNEMVEATEAFHHALLIEDDPFEIEVKRQHMVEEMADAWIVMQQNIYFHSSTEEFEDFVKAKIERTLERIEDGYYGSTRI